MKIQITYDPKPISLRQFDWSATDSSTYDGAPDSSTHHQIGFGRTEAEAVQDLLQILEEDV